ncbi:MAG TPA: putative baseplate assembly protein [Sphingomicrobium sp.]|nr:putative baseplate assembly protein [Sphingomicrobium sp.]
MLTPVDHANRAALPAIAWRAGTHGQFVATMKARLAAVTIDATGPDGNPLDPPVKLRPLKDLTTRDSGDFSIALLDGFASLGDLLCFYEERIANEGYLRTATERRSILELASLVGYKLRPGVASGVHLAFAVDQNQVDPVTIEAGARAQSLPGPGETPQSFETSEDLLARREWNDLAPRRLRPQKITLSTVLAIDSVHVVSRATNLRPGDPLLFVFDHPLQRGARRIVAATDEGEDPKTTIVRLVPVAPALAAAVPVLLRFADSAGEFREGEVGGDQRTVLWGDRLLQYALMEQSGTPADWADEMRNMADVPLSPELEPLIADLKEDIAEAVDAAGQPGGPATTDPSRFVDALLKPRIPQVASSAQLRRSLAGTFHAGADPAPQLLLNLAPQLRDGYYAAWANANVATSATQLVGVFALRVSAVPFGANAGKEPRINRDFDFATYSQWEDWDPSADETDNAIWLDQAYPAIVTDGYAVVERFDRFPMGNDFAGAHLYRVVTAETRQRAAYGLTGKSTRIILDRDWWSAPAMADLRSTSVMAASEKLELAEEPVPGDVGGNTVELGALYKELKSGRFVIVSGERSDIEGVTGVRTSELMVLANVVHGYDLDRPGDKTHTTLTFATGTAHRYKRESVVIYGNVVRATHGETRNELLGSGDGAAALQSFTLKQPPLTFTSVPTAEGAETTLAVYVDDVAWKESQSLERLGPKDRGFVTATDDADKTTVTFGDGAAGARLPTGVQNVRAVYRSGIGAPGNVRAEQISLLQTRPLGVTAVINPLRASGGADRESRDLARENAPLSVATLDRIVSVADYAAFTRRFAGIAKAVARATTDGRRHLVHITVAGVDDAPIDPDSDLYRNLTVALRRLGDPALPLAVEPRELRLLVLTANIRILPDYLWDKVSAKVRATLLDRFGFHRRQLGQPARLAQIIAAIHSVKGVAYVDVDTFGAIPEKVSDKGERRLVTQDEILARVANMAARLSDPDTSSAHGLTAGASRTIADVMAWPGGFDRGHLRPAELAMFTPAVPDTLILNEVP